MSASPLMEIRSSNGIGRESARDVGMRDRDSSRYTKEREHEHDRERGHHSHPTGPGPPLVLERPGQREREREREYERESRERPSVHHSHTLPTPLRTTSAIPSTSNSPSPKLHYPYQNGHPTNTSHHPDAHRRHTVPFPPPNSSSSPSLGRSSVHSSAQHHDLRAPLPPSTSHPTSFSRHQLQSQPRRLSQGHNRDEESLAVSPISPVPGDSGAPFASSRSTFPPPHPTPSGARRLSGVSSGTASVHATGTTATSPIVVSPTDSVDDLQRSSVLGKRERERDRESESRRDSITSTGAPLTRSRSGSGSTGRPPSVVLAPHLVRGGGSTHVSPRMHSSTAQSQSSSSYQYSHPNHPSPQSTPHPVAVAQPPAPVYTGVLPTPSNVPPGSVVYVYGYPPPGQAQPAQIVHPSQSGNPLLLSSNSHHPHMQPQPLPHSPISARAPNPTSAPPQAGSHSLPHSQSQGQPVTRRQTYPQQIPSHPTQQQPPQPHSQQHSHHPHQQQLHGQPQGHPHGSHGSSQQQQQQHHHHPQPHHQHTYPPPSGIKQIPLSPNMKHRVSASTSSPTVAHPPSHSQSHGGNHRSQHTNAQDAHHHQPPPTASSGGGGGGSGGPSSVSASTASTTTSGTSTHSVHPAVTAAIQRILNTAYADLLLLVDKETTGAVHSLDKERSKREKVERALEERDRILRAREDEVHALGNALRAAHGPPTTTTTTVVVGSDPEKEKEMSKLLSENTHLKSELMGLKDDKEEMQEEIDQLTEKLALGGGGGGDGSAHLKELEELRAAESRRIEEIQMLRGELERWRDEAQVWRQERAMFKGELDERDKEIKVLLERQKQLEQSSTNTEQAASMITASPTEAITASPLPFIAPLSSSPRPSSRQSVVDGTPHHSSTLPVPPIMGSLPPQSPRLATNSIGRPPSQHDVVDEKRHHRPQPPQRPQLTLPVSFSDERPLSSRPSSAVSPPRPSMSLPLPTPDRPLSAHLSPNQLSIPLPVPFPTSRPPSRPSLNGRKRSREDFNGEPVHRREREDIDKPETPSRTDPPSRPLASPTTMSREKASKVAKRHSGDDASTASGPPPPPAANDMAITPSTPTFATTKNPYGTYPKPRPKSGSISVEDGVFRHVQHPSRGMTVSQQFHFQQQQQQQQQTSTFWKSVPSSASTTTQAKKDEEPKLSFKHLPLLYETVGKDFICRECKTSTTSKRKTFPSSTPFPEIWEHSWQEHEDRCKEILKYSPAKLTEEQVLLKGGGGVLLGKAAGNSGSKSTSQRKEKSNSK